MSSTSAFLGWHIIPNLAHEKAYLFTGRPTIDFFDFKTRTWGSFLTKFTRNDPADKDAGIKAWPYPGNILTDSTHQLVGNKLYVFGGTHRTTNIGCNLFMVLDLQTREWRRLSGTVLPEADTDYLSPGPRKTPSSWTDKSGKKIYLVFGECDRMGAKMKGQLHGDDCGHPFDDF